MHRDCADAAPSLVGQSRQIREVRRLIEKTGRSKTPVLLLGESGTGKEVVARAIHLVNPSGPFVPIDCGALVGPLMESELFGHAKGAFTGATQAKRGLIEMAQGGTAFFDEIGDLPLDLQVKLLRLLQEHEFRAVGSLASSKIDIRVIAATNRELSQEVSRGGFRQDLFYRLNVVKFRLPPLRERKEDIPPLIDYFLARQGKEYRLSREAMDAMLGYDWPGNVRELENCIQRMVALNSGPVLCAADLPSPLQNYLAAHGRRAMAAVAGGGPNWDRGNIRSSEIIPLAQLEKRAILDALQHTRGDRETAARLLGIGRTTLYRKLKEYRLGEE